MTREERVAKELGIGKEEVERLLAENAPVDASVVARVEAHLGAAAGTHAAWIGKPLASFHQRAVCGSTTVSTPAGKIVAPLGFISAAAGLLLLADILGGRGGRGIRDEATRPNYMRMDMLGSPVHADRDDCMPDPGYACICGNPDYVDTYRSRYA